MRKGNMNYKHISGQKIIKEKPKFNFSLRCDKPEGLTNLLAVS